jgi:RNA recognition motif-containing protein
LKKLYIGNIPYTCTDQDLAEWFTQGGFTSQSVTILRDRATGQSRGFGFVEIQNDEEADRAIASMNGKAFMGRALVVNEARPPAPRGPGGGGRGEGGGGGRERRGGGGGGGRYRE